MFVAKDLCDVLEVENSRQALTRLDEDEKGVILNDTLKGMQQFSIVNESGMYSLILSSRKPEASVFKKRITSEVIPSIRKTGLLVQITLTHAVITNNAVQGLYGSLIAQ